MVFQFYQKFIGENQNFMGNVINSRNSKKSQKLATLEEMGENVYVESDWDFFRETTRVNIIRKIHVNIACS